MLCDRGRPKLHDWLIAAALGAGCTALGAGCSREVGAPASDVPTDRPPPGALEQLAGPVVPGPLAAASASPQSSAAAASSTLPAPERTFMRVELAPTQGDLAPLLREQVSLARDRKLRPFVEFYADWCKPCRDLSALMEDARMREALRSTYIIKINVDDWQDKLRGTGFVPREIPVFYALDADGRPAGRQILGYVRGVNAPEKLIPRLSAFFQG